MFRITTSAGEIITTEKPDFIRVHKNGCYVLCDRSEAEGVACGGTPYLFKDGVVACEFDGGESMDNLAAENRLLAEKLAETTEALELILSGVTEDEA